MAQRTFLENNCISTPFNAQINYLIHPVETLFWITRYAMIHRNPNPLAIWK